jgi:UDP-glucose 4-epimerase
MATLVVGGAGYIGYHAVYQLIDAGKDVVVIDHLQSGHREAVHPRPRLSEEVIRDRAFLDRVFTEETIEQVIHFAAFALVGESMTEPLR